MALKAATNRHDLAALLRFQTKMMTSIVYATHESLKYKTFKVPKKSGGDRTIAAPIPQLKLLQRRLADLLMDCHAAIMDTHPHRKGLQFGYLPELSVVDNAYRHRRRRMVLNVDLADFFSSINFGRVRGFFLSDAAFQLHPVVATTIAQIACWNNELPQGSPCSPIISGLIGGILDRRLGALAREHGCTYSRYVDDLTFSTNADTFPNELAALDPATGRWAVGGKLSHAVGKAGFLVNPDKTRLFGMTGRQTVTGLVVNDKVNINRDYEMRTRAAVHHFIRKGVYTVPASLESVAAGKPPEKETSPHRLEGMLQWIYSVRDFSDDRKDGSKRHHPTSFSKVYREFLFAKHFLFMDKPLILCEGKTDNVYLNSALKRLAASYPSLGSWVGADFKSNLRLFRYTSKSLQILHLGGGCGDIVQLVRDYRRLWTRLVHRQIAQPVVLVVDNDEGGASVFKAIKEVGGPDIKIAEPKILFHVFHNLYIIKTPCGSGTPKSCVEDLFDAATLGQTLGGKTFNPACDEETAKHYGKKIFAEGVIRPNWKTIDFAGFHSILASLEDAIKGYYGMLVP
ncbi:retron Ec67 family RNA-directed DNA polymerase/endonuclease [Novosphingobium terrae]|uniref:retron Ec67 family RNA-directed DNA polymerase/endonuclease n=1 Tax=Novosphingobium terrae TaxID=2726189 RepID=UPI0019826513|nr:retron Ec67 family RNA-directed DNA polymerase/endonuclease [Novosphingobium terrae]